MSFVEWHPSFELGVAEFDEHHKHLVNLLNAGYDAFVNKTNGTSLDKVLDELIDYATYHFSAEEYWMNKQHYPGLDAHKKEHACFSARVGEMHRDQVHGKSPSMLEALTFIKNWIANHILESDAEYGRYVSVKFS